MDLEEALKLHGVTKVQLTRELGIGTTTLWRIARGRPVSGAIAEKLCARFPELSFRSLTLGRETKAAS